jgi:hypothetical protein
METAITKRGLPTIQQLRDDATLEAMAKDNVLNVLLNHEPDPSWLKEHPMVKNLKYIPIGRIEWLLTRIFVNWYVEIKTVQLIGNSVVVTIRLHYQNVTDDQWSWTDGVGASPLQTDSGAGAIDFMKLKSSAVMLAAPAAESYAVKDAAEKLGKLFGKDISRKDTINYETLINSFVENTQKADAEKLIAGFTKYKGADCEKLKHECAERLKNNTLDREYAQSVAVKIGVTL